MTVLSVGRAGTDLHVEAPEGSLLAIVAADAETLAPVAARLERGRDLALDATRLRRRDIARVAPDLGLLPHLTLAANAALPLAFRGLPRAQRQARALAALEAAGVPAPGRRARTASAADQARVTWARASLAGARLLLLRDPLAAEPAATREAALWILRRLHALSGATTLLLTTDAPAAMALADHLAVLEAGRITQAGPPAALHARPATATAARLTGPANLLPGHIIDADDDLARVRLRAGHTVEGVPSRPLRPRDPCLVLIRPENIAMANAAAADLGQGALDAIVAGTLTTATDLQIHLLLGPGTPLHATRPRAAARPLTQGQSVAIAWQPEHALVLG